MSPGSAAVPASWSIWVGIELSAGPFAVRVAQQLTVFANLLPIAIVALIARRSTWLTPITDTHSRA